MNEQQRVERARWVQSFLECAEWIGAWAAVRDTYIKVIESEADDAKALEARNMLRAAIAARQHLELFIADGAFANADIAARRSVMRI